MKRRGPSTWGGFTLIELLVVIAIIIILVSMTLGAMRGVQNQGAQARARAEIEALSASLESYKADWGDYPLSSVFTNASLLTNSLYGALCPPTGKIYFEFKRNQTNVNGIIDPWGNPYNYVYTNGSPNNGVNFFDLWAVPKNAQNPSNTNCWIKNW